MGVTSRQQSTPTPAARKSAAASARPRHSATCGIGAPQITHNPKTFWSNPIHACNTPESSISKGWEMTFQASMFFNLYVCEERPDRSP